MAADTSKLALAPYSGRKEEYSKKHIMKASQRRCPESPYYILSEEVSCDSASSIS
jgi:hypothetical protein